MLPVINVDGFGYHKDTKSFTAFASDLPGGLRLGRVWNDACDEGFEMYNPKTGNVRVMVIDNIDERDGDIRAWEFKSYHKGADGRAKLTASNEFTAVVYND